MHFYEGVAYEKLESNSFEANVTFRIFINSIELRKTSGYIFIAFVEKVDGVVLSGRIA